MLVLIMMSLTVFNLDLVIGGLVSLMDHGEVHHDTGIQAGGPLRRLDDHDS